MSELAHSLTLTLRALPSDSKRLAYLRANVRADGVKTDVRIALEAELTVAETKSYRQALERYIAASAASGVFFAGHTFVCPAGNVDADSGLACLSPMGEQTHADVGSRTRYRGFQAVYADTGDKVTKATLTADAAEGRERDIIPDAAEVARYSGSVPVAIVADWSINGNGSVKFRGAWTQVQATCRAACCKDPRRFPNAVKRHDTVLG